MSEDENRGEQPAAVEGAAAEPPPAAAVVRIETVDKYPRLWHYASRRKLHFIRLTDNEMLGYKDMKAFCQYHANCTLTRTCIPQDGEGRPLGLLYAWLSAGSRFTSKSQHKDISNRPDLYERQFARRRLIQRLPDTPDMRLWLQAELPCPSHPGEICDCEPDDP